MLKKLEITVYDGDPLKPIADWLADASCYISDALGYDVKKFKIVVTIEDKE
jgi:hypothetical protein